MLQRVQTYYLGLIIIIQGIVIAGLDFITFITEDFSYRLNAWGLTKTTNQLADDAWPSGEETTYTTIPVFIGFIALALLAFLCIMSYKNLDRQLKLGRTLFYLYFVSVLSIYLMAVFGDSFVGDRVIAQEIGVPYWVFICGLPLAFLANTGIKRDKRLLDSLKRL